MVVVRIRAAEAAEKANVSLGYMENPDSKANVLGLEAGGRSASTVDGPQWKCLMR